MTTATLPAGKELQEKLWIAVAEEINHATKTAYENALGQKYFDQKSVDRLSILYRHNSVSAQIAVLQRAGLIENQVVKWTQGK